MVTYDDRGIPVLYDQFDIKANLNYYITKDGKMEVFQIIMYLMDWLLVLIQKLAI